MPTTVATSELDRLHAAVVAHPAEDTPRLMYADEVEETDPARAQFIRDQFRLAEIGPPRFQVEFTALGRRGGPGYYQVVGVDGDEIPLGARCDLVPHVTPIERFHRRLNDPERMATHLAANTLHGLVLRRREVDDPALGTTRLTFREDEFSRPYPVAERVELQKRVDAGFIVGWRVWGPPAPGEFRPWFTESRGAPRGPQIWGQHFEWTFERGFVSAVGCTPEWWAAHGTAMCAAAPICSVSLTRAPSVVRRSDPASGRTSFHLVGLVGVSEFSESIWTSELNEERFGPRAAADPNSVAVRLVARLLKRACPSVTRWSFPGAPVD